MAKQRYVLHLAEQLTYALKWPLWGTLPCGDCFAYGAGDMIGIEMMVYSHAIYLYGPGRRETNFGFMMSWDHGQVQTVANWVDPTRWNDAGKAFCHSIDQITDGLVTLGLRNANNHTFLAW